MLKMLKVLKKLKKQNKQQEQQEQAEQKEQSTVVDQKKKYPEAIVLRRGMVLVAIGFVAVLVIIVFNNIYRSSHQKQVASTHPATVSVYKPDWYQKEEVRKPVAPVAPDQASSGVKDTNSVSGPVSGDSANKNNQVTAIDNQSDNQNTGSPSELKKAMNAPISSNQITQEPGSNANSAQQSGSLKLPETKEPEGASANNDDPNMQGEKKAFLKTSSQADGDYLQEPLKNPLTPYELKAGSIIPAILITGINSELPGQITGQVRENVYDTISGKYLLVPQGAKLVGLYDSQIAYGQERVLIAWKRIIFPNGQSIDLEGMPGIDLSGYAGFHDVVDNHYFKIFGSVILMSVISAGAQLSQPQQQFSNNQQLSVSQMLAASLGTNIMNTGNMMTQKNLNIQPTLIINPGYLFNVNITKDMVFPSAYDDRTSYEN